MKVLVADDSRVMRDMIVACLRPREDLEFTHAASGLEALERLSLAAFDLLVLDLQMPDVGGLEVIKFVRGQDKLRALPILVVTTADSDAARATALRAGTSRFLTKPFTPAAILSEANALLARALV